jgi:hypothetical protein
MKHNGLDLDEFRNNYKLSVEEVCNMKTYQSFFRLNSYFRGVDKVLNLIKFTFLSDLHKRFFLKDCGYDLIQIITNKEGKFITIDEIIDDDVSCGCDYSIVDYYNFKKNRWFKT